MSVQFDVPQIGKFEVNGVAEEETLKAILQELKAARPSGRPNPLQDQQNRGLRESSEALRDHSTSTRKSKTAADAAAMTFDALKSHTANVIKSFDAFAKSPVDFGSTMAHAIVDVTTAVTSSVPVIGAAVAGVGKLAKVANDFLASEFKKRAETLDKISSVGASFAGGMTEISDMAHNAGLGISEFASVVKNNRDTLHQTGLSGAESASLLSDGMRSLSKTIGPSGRSLRDELQAMGVSVEQSGAVMSLYASQQRTAGKSEFEIRTNLAQGTREYASHLKVLSDITGKDAAQLAKKAQDEAMRGSLYGKLSGKQLEAYETYYTMTKDMTGATTAMNQAINGMTINVEGISGTPMEEAIRNMAAAIKSGDEDMKIVAERELKYAQEKMQKQQNMDDLVTATNGVGMSSVVTSMGNTQNQLNLIIGRAERDRAKKSMTAAEKQAQTTDKMTKNFVDISNNARDMQVELEMLADDLLPAYSDMMATVTDMTMKTVIAGVQVAEGKVREAAITMGLIEDKPKKTSFLDTMIGDDKEVHKVKYQQEAWDRDYNYFKNAKNEDGSAKGLYDAKTGQTTAFSDEAFKAKYGQRPEMPAELVAQAKKLEEEKNSAPALPQIAPSGSKERRDSIRARNAEERKLKRKREEEAEAKEREAEAKEEEAKTSSPSTSSPTVEKAIKAVDSFARDMSKDIDFVKGLEVWREIRDLLERSNEELRRIRMQ